jgi:hypothetical protein
MFFSRSILVSSNLIGLLSICFLSVSSVATVVFLLLIIFYIDTTHFHHHQTFKELGHSLTRSGFDPQPGAKDFSCSLCVQTGSGAHIASCTMGTGGPLPGAKTRPGRDADHSPLSSAEVENE